MICRNCNKTIADNMDFCPHCGQKTNLGGSFKKANGFGIAPSSSGGSSGGKNPDIRINMGGAPSNRYNEYPRETNHVERATDRNYKGDYDHYDGRMHNTRNGDFYCPSCGASQNAATRFCTSCGHDFKNAATRHTFSSNNGAVKFIPSFVIGLIAAIFGMFGGLCLSVCATFVGSSAEVFIFIFGGSMIGLVGACLCFSKAHIGSIMQIVSSIMILIGIFGFIGSDMMTLISAALFFISGVMGTIVSFMNIFSKK